MSCVTSAYIDTAHSSKADRSRILNGLESLINRSLDIVAQTKLPSLHNFAKSTILSYFRRIKYGVLTVEVDGVVHIFGENYVLESDGFPRELKASIQVLHESFWLRIFMHPDFGFAVPICDSPTHFMDLKAISRKDLALQAVMQTANQPAFIRFCAIFDDEAGGHTGDLKEARTIAPPRNLEEPSFRHIPPDDLERGQMAKLHLIARKAKIRKGSRVLDIGGGWGSFAILAAKEYGAIVDVLTISESQKTAADALIAVEGFSTQIKVHLMDYRDMPPHFENAFDAVISIGVTEHIGFEFLDGWFKKIAWAMKPQNSFKVFTMSTVPDTRWKQFRSGAALSSPRTLVNAIADAGLNIVSIDDISPHYTRTAREWGYRFDRNFETHIKSALKKHDPLITEQGLEIFRRKWTYYFAYCEAGFALSSKTSLIVAQRSGI
ncbi:hypothetical protein H0H92_011975 [Tricholoma furcatifolium]|nr:hypothetical protein H0H92_011975 [Tricholoma furcatifolium]